MCVCCHVQLFVTARLLCPWDFLGKTTGVGCHFLLQGIFPTQGVNSHLLQLLHWQANSLPLHHPRNPTRKRRMTKSTEIPITGEDKDLILHSNHTLVYCASSENLALPHTVSFVFSWKCYFKVMAWASLVFLGILCMRASLVTQLAKNPPAMGETWVRALGLEDLLEKREVTHPSILTWRIPWTV